MSEVVEYELGISDYFKCPSCKRWLHYKSFCWRKAKLVKHDVIPCKGCRALARIRQ